MIKNCGPGKHILYMYPVNEMDCLLIYHRSMKGITEESFAQSQGTHYIFIDRRRNGIAFLRFHLVTPQNIHTHTHTTHYTHLQCAASQKTHTFLQPQILFKVRNYKGTRMREVRRFFRRPPFCSSPHN